MPSKRKLNIKTNELSDAVDKKDIEKLVELIISHHDKWLDTSASHYRINYHIDFCSYLNRDVIEKELKLTGLKHTFEIKKLLPCSKAVTLDKKINPQTRQEVEKEILSFQRSACDLTAINLLRNNLLEILGNVNEKLDKGIKELEILNDSINELNTQLQDETTQGIIKEYNELKKMLPPQMPYSKLRGETSELVALECVKSKYSEQHDVIVFSGMTFTTGDPTLQKIKEEFDIIVAQLDPSDPKRIASILEIVEVKSSLAPLHDDWKRLKGALDHLKKRVLEGDITLNLKVKNTKESYSLSKTALDASSVKYYVNSDESVPYFLFSLTQLERMLKKGAIMDILANLSLSAKEKEVSLEKALLMADMKVPGQTLLDGFHEILKTNLEVCDLIHFVSSDKGLRDEAGSFGGAGFFGEAGAQKGAPGETSIPNFLDTIGSGFSTNM
jgi:hypothetical protein